MKNLDTRKINSKKNTVVGTIKQAKGVARERIGTATNNPRMQLAGKKDQVVGTLQKGLGSSLLFRRKTLFATIAAAAALVLSIFYFFNRETAVNTQVQ